MAYPFEDFPPEHGGIRKKSRHLDTGRRASPQLVEQLRAIVDFELGVQAAHISHQGLNAHVQPRRDGGLRETFGQRQTDFLFPRDRRQPCSLRWSCSRSGS